MEKSRRYCNDSGDSYYLVRSFCGLATKLLEYDQLWARELAHEAARWSPNDPTTWSLLARALEAEGDWRRAEAVYWHARRRFPHNVQTHCQLAHALILHEQADAGLAILRQTVQLFPDEPVGWSDLAHGLRITGNHEEAVGIYRQAQDRFKQNPVIANALTDTLIDLGKLPEAAQALAWAEQVVPARDTKLKQIRERLKRAQNGEAIILKQLSLPKIGNDGPISALADITGVDFSDAPSLGSSTLWRRQDRFDLAQDSWQNLPEGIARIIEAGLWQGATAGWEEAVNWFEKHLPIYDGDGVLRVHVQLARRRAGHKVDWSLERQRYPHLLTVIRTEEEGHPPRPVRIDTDEIDEEQRQDQWFAELADRGDSDLLNLAEEDLLASRHLL